MTKAAAGDKSPGHDAGKCIVWRAIRVLIFVLLAAPVVVAGLALATMRSSDPQLKRSRGGQKRTNPRKSAMKFIHRIALRATAAQQSQLTALGINLQNKSQIKDFVAFDIDEDHPNWIELKNLFRIWQASDIMRTEFTKKEISEACWFEFSAWHHGYPQPDEDELGYLNVTYDLSNYCDNCGIGKKQKSNFVMKGEPKFGKNGIMQLNWIYDEIFVTQEVWLEVFKQFGLNCRTVLNTNGNTLRTVVQIMIDTCVIVATNEITPIICTKCFREKFYPVVRGTFPAPVVTPTAPIIRTAEYFGSGAQADKRLLVSKEIRNALLKRNVRGGHFTPIEV